METEADFSNKPESEVYWNDFLDAHSTTNKYKYEKPYFFLENFNHLFIQNKNSLRNLQNISDPIQIGHKTSNKLLNKDQITSNSPKPNIRSTDHLCMSSVQFKMRNCFGSCRYRLNHENSSFAQLP